MAQDYLVVEFEEHRPRLRAMAYRMLGSLTEADDAVQEAWLRLARVDGDDIDNVAGWLTTVVGRVCLDLLRARSRRREDPLETRMPDLLLGRADGSDDSDPEQQALLAEAVGLALQVVLDSLTPAERLAFVLHDLFGLPFAQIAPIVNRTPETAKKLASRARKRVRDAAPNPDPDLAGQRRAVTAFRAAARDGDIDGLLAVLDPDVVLRADRGALAGGLQSLRGAEVVAGQAASFRRTAGAAIAHPVLINGAAGLATTLDDTLISLMSFTVVGGRIATIDVLADPERLARVDLAELVG